MPKEEQKEFLAVSRAELTYFLGLIDDLFFIADLGEPRYKKTAQKIDLLSLLNEETKSRQKTEPRIQWDLEYEKTAETDATLLGDPLLIQRLVRNILDNAGKHARSHVKVRFSVISGGLLGLQVNDNGPGISDEAIALFGQRRKQRISSSESRQGASLGLGSVIMKTILELHGGELKITRSNGTSVQITLPRDHTD
jgi:signal transduction histidine kinase